MKLIVDHQLPPALTRWLEDRGYQAEHVFHLGLGQASDADIWGAAGESGVAIITKDADFAIRRSAAAHGPIIIWLRIGNSTTPSLLKWLEKSWSGVESAMKNGRTVIEVR